MADPLALRIRYRLKFVEDPVEKRLLVEAVEALEGGEGALTGARVMAWMEEQGVSLVPWQVQRLEKL